MHKGVIWTGSWAALTWLGIFRGKGGKRGGGVFLWGTKVCLPTWNLTVLQDEGLEAKRNCLKVVKEPLGIC